MLRRAPWAVAGAAFLVAASLFVRHRVELRPKNPSALDARWHGCIRLDSVHCARDARYPLELFLPATARPTGLRDAKGQPVPVRRLGRVMDREVYAIEGEPRGELAIAFEGGRTHRVSVDEDPSNAALAHIDALRRQGLHRQAIAAVDAALPSLTGRTAVRALYISARAAFAAGEAVDAAARFRSMASRAHELSLDDDEAIGRLTAAFVESTRLGKLSEALALVDDRDGFWIGRPEHRATWLYYRATVFMYGAAHRKAIADLTEARGLFAQLEHREEALDATATLSSVYAALGRADEALRLVSSVDRTTLPTDGCVAFFFANNAAFASLRSAERATPPWSRNDAARARALEEAASWLAFLRAFPTGACSDEGARSLTDVHEAEHAKLAGLTSRLDELLVHATMRRELRLPVVELAWAELELARASELHDLAAGERIAARLLKDAEALDQPHSAWAAHMALARLHRRRSMALARRELEAAEAILDRTLHDVAVGDGRNAFLSAHEASAAELFDLLLETHAYDDALRLARKSARRAIDAAAAAFTSAGDRSPAQEDALRTYREVKVRTEEAAAHDWELPTHEVADARQHRADDLREARRALEAAFDERREVRATVVPDDLKPAADEALLAVHPTSGGYAALVIDRSGARVARVTRDINPGEREAVARELLRGTVAQLAEGTTVHLTAYGPLRPFDWTHAALDDLGTPLVARFALVEHLGLGPTPTLSRNGAAVVVADAAGDLPYAAREGAFVRERLSADELRGEQATRVAVTRAIESSSFVHYAGHGRFAGADGFESELLLASGSTLSVSDVLLLDRVPAIAVLSGCELARSDDASGESFGIAQAMLARGGRYAIAPSRTVKDTLAERFVHALYEDGPLDEAIVPRRMQAALRALATELPHEDWSTFRLLAR